MKWNENQKNQQNVRKPADRKKN